MELENYIAITILQILSRCNVVKNKAFYTFNNFYKNLLNLALPGKRWNLNQSKSSTLV